LKSKREGLSHVFFLILLIPPLLGATAVCASAFGGLKCEWKRCGFTSLDICSCKDVPHLWGNILGWYSTGDLCVFHIL